MNTTPTRGLAIIAALAVFFAFTIDADAQRRRRKRNRKRPPAAQTVKPDPQPQADDTTPTPKKSAKPKVFDFTGIDIGGRMRTPQLLYFLDRATEELDRAALEKRSFIPEMTRTMEDEGL